MILNESSRDNLLQPYVEILDSKGIKTNVSQLKQFLLAKFVNEAYIRNLSLESNYYLAGVARYYFEGKLTSNKVLNVFNNKVKDVFVPDVCQKLNALILVLRNAYIDTIGETWEQPEDFGQLPIEKLLRKYGSAIKKELANEPEAKQEAIDTLNREKKVGNGYTFDILYSYADARKYNKATEPGAWCITYGESHYNYYRNNLHIHYVIFAKDGYESVPREKGPNWTSRKPQDEYGNSLIAVLQSNSSWNPVYITSRWNHGSFDDDSRCEADHAYTTEEFMEKTGVTKEDLERIYQIWKADKKDEDVNSAEKPKQKELMRKFKYAQMKLNGGNFENLFGDDECEFIKLLSNTESYKKIQDSFLPTNTEEQNAILAKKEQKLLRNSVTLNRVRLFDANYFFLRDGNKILFDTIFRETNVYSNLFNFYSTSDNISKEYTWIDGIALNKKNIISIRKPKLNGHLQDCDYIMLYDYRKHAFVEIEGIKKFKYVAEVGRWDVEDSIGGFYEVAMSQNQIALVDLGTNTPVVLPNGRSWVEEIEWRKGSTRNYSRTVRTKFLQAKDGVVHFLVDSSSGEGYFFDMHTKKFFEPLMPNNFEPNSRKYYSIANDWKLPDYYSIIYAGYGIENTTLYLNGKPVEIGGSYFADNIKYIGSGLVFLIIRDNRRFLFCHKTNKIIDVPEEYNNLRLKDTYRDAEEKVVFEFGDWRNGMNLIFDVDFLQFVKNPLYGGYIFKVYSIGDNMITVYKDNDKNSGRLISLYIEKGSVDLFPEKDENGEIKERNVAIYESIGSIYSLDENDIKNMVYEIIKRL